MSGAAKVMFVAEIAVCFGPAIALFIAGAAFVPFQLYFVIAKFEPYLLISVLSFVAWVIAGCLGTIALLDISRGILNPSPYNGNSKTAFIFAVVGIAALPPFLLVFSDATRLIPLVLLPFAAAMHVLYLARGFIFDWVPRRDGKDDA